MSATHARLSLPMHMQVWRLAWPMILSNITVPLLGLVDTAVVGHLDSPVYLGAVAVAANLFSVLFWAFGFLRMSTTGHVAQAYGEDDHPKLILLLGQSLMMAVVLGLALILLQTPLISIGLDLLNPDADVRLHAEAYAAIRIYSAPAVLANYALLGWFLGMQNSRIPLVLLVFGNLVNICLDILFVYGFEWAVPGVALATLIADYVCLLLGGWFAWRYLKGFDAKLDLTALIEISRYRALISSNRYLLVRTLLLLFVFSFFTRQGAQLGPEILAANAVLLNFLMLTSHGLDGFAHAIEALSGRYYGAKDRQGLSQACWSAAFLSVITAVLLALFFALLGPWIIQLLTSLPEVIALTDRYQFWIVLLPIVAVWGYLFDGIFIGLHWFRRMQNAMVACVLLIYLPCWWLTQPMGNHGLWLTLSLFMLSRGLIAFALLWRNKIHLI